MIVPGEKSEPSPLASTIDIENPLVLPGTPQADSNPSENQREEEEREKDVDSRLREEMRSTHFMMTFELSI